MERSELLKSYEEELDPYMVGIVTEYFFETFCSYVYCIYRNDLEKQKYKDDRLRKLDILLFIQCTQREPDIPPLIDNKTWYFCLYDIHTKEFPIDLLPDYLQPLYQKYLDNTLVIPDDIPKDVLPLYNNFQKGISLRPLLNLKERE
ncbi:MAG: hypothetical protein NZZ41_03150 [Candidatus Dojkabacteria bacterium]|nr:hypothetical protein [Candidatus Dojkabacteria bacterium]